jgi:Tol biopolymer transport system component
MLSQRIGRVGTGTALALLVVPLTALAQSPGVTTRASVSSAGVQADGSSFAPSVSEDGRWVAFASAAANLVPSDGNGVIDVFVRDRLAETTERVSVATDGTEANGRSDTPKISRNGRFVAFQSAATNLIESDGNAKSDVFVHDRDTGVTERVSRAIDGGDPDSTSFVDSISDDGRYVGFWSGASNLVDDDGNDTWDSFVFDRDTRTTERVSVSMTGSDADQDSYWAAVSGDGRFVAFGSRASNLTPQQIKFGGKLSVFVRDRVAGTTKRISQQPSGFYETGDSGEPSMSRDGRFVAYSSTSKNLTKVYLDAKRRIYVTDVQTGATKLVAPDFANQDCPGSSCRLLAAGVPSISGDGRFVGFMSSSQRMMPANFNGAGQQARVYVVDRLNGLLRRISVEPNLGNGSACANRPAISGDGRVVAYHTNSDDLVVDDTNVATDVLVSEWACANTGAYAAADALPASCDPTPACPDAPADACALATRAVLDIQTHAPGTDGPSRARLRWSWRGSSTLPDFGDPTDASSYALCVYAGPDERLQLEEQIPAGAGWSATRRGFAYEAEVGVTNATLRAGRKSGIQVVGDGPELDLPYLPLDEGGPVLVRLHRSDGGCFASDLAPTEIRKNKAALQRVDRPGRPGRFVARHP